MKEEICPRIITLISQRDVAIYSKRKKISHSTNRTSKIHLQENIPQFYPTFKRASADNQKMKTVILLGKLLTESKQIIPENSKK